MTQTRVIVALGLIVTQWAAGCTTAPTVLSMQTPDERAQQLLAIAEQYDRKGQSQAALRIYDHLLIQQPRHRVAQERRQLLSERAGLLSSTGSDSKYASATRSSSNQNTNAIPHGPVPTSAVPDNSPLSIEAELKAAARLRPVSPAENSLRFAGTIEAIPVEGTPDANTGLRHVSAASEGNELKGAGGVGSVSENTEVKTLKSLQPVRFSPDTTSDVDERRWKSSEPKSLPSTEEAAFAEPLFSGRKGIRQTQSFMWSRSGHPDRGKSDYYLPGTSHDFSYYSGVQTNEPIGSPVMPLEWGITRSVLQTEQNTVIGLNGLCDTQDAWIYTVAKR